MRVTHLSLYSGNIEILTLALSKVPTTDQYMVREIVGLDSDDLFPRFYGFGLQTKPKYYDIGMKARTIVMSVILNPRFNLNETVSDIRDTIYRAISSVRTGLVTMHFMAYGSIVAKLDGFITKIEADHFAQMAEVKVTIRCDNPIFRGINPIRYLTSEVKTTNPVILPDSISTAPHGFQFQLTFKASAPSFTIQDAPSNPEWLFKVIPSGGFLTGDVLYFSSEYSDKYLYMVRGTTTTYLIDKIQPESVWPIIFPGATTLYFLEIASFNWNKVEYYAAYWGV